MLAAENVDSGCFWELIKVGTFINSTCSRQNKHNRPAPLGVDIQRHCHPALQGESYTISSGLFANYLIAGCERAGQAFRAPACYAARVALAETAPTKLAGLAAVLRFVRKQRPGSEDDFFFDGDKESRCFVAAIERAVLGLMARQS